MANAVIKKDIGMLEKSDKLTDINAVKLKKESLKLEEHANSKWRCWVWLIIAFVLIVFLSKYFVYKTVNNFQNKAVTSSLMFNKCFHSYNTYSIYSEKS